MKTLILFLTMLSSVSGVTFTDIPDSAVFQFPHTGRTPGTFPVITGTYTGEPTSISACVKDYNVDTVVKAWTVINNSPTGGSFSDTLKDIPRGGPYVLCVKTSLGDSATGTNPWGVGEVIGAFGQSNIAPLHNGYESTNPHVDGWAMKILNDYTYKKMDANWVAGNSDSTVTCPLVSCANTVLSGINNAYPIAFCGWAAAGSSMTFRTPGVYYWGDRNVSNPQDLTSLYGNLITRIVKYKPYIIIMYQGEGDIGISTSTYTTVANKVFNDLQTDLGYKPIICIVQTRFENYDHFNMTASSSIPQAHQNLANDTTVFLAATTYDLDGDWAHLTTDAQNICGKRLGKTIAKILNNDISNGYRFYVKSAVATGKGKIRLYTSKINGHTILNSNNCSRFSYRTSFPIAYYPATNLSIVSDTMIDVAVSDRTMYDSCYVEYDRYRISLDKKYGIIYDSDSLPLEPFR